ncbi:MAG: alpha/beta hydrolase family protein [Gammaproteobacteria bacterium]
MDQRQGRIENVALETSQTADGLLSASVTLLSDSGLSVYARVLRAPSATNVPLLIVLGGHRTGRDAVDLFKNVDHYAVVAMDYPYDGPQRIRGMRQTLSALPKARRAFRDTPPAVSLMLDWLDQQAWAGGPKLLIGASLGVPFAAKTAARDARLDGVILVHGAADNERWLTVQVARRVDQKILHEPLGTMLHWLAYGPTFDTAKNVALIAPRPVLIIGARQDERTPADEITALYAATQTPKRLRWTDGLHVEPDRTDVVDQMMQIAAEEMTFLLGPR